jgi:osmotically-inducible protein OsmY
MPSIKTFSMILLCSALISATGCRSTAPGKGATVATAPTKAAPAKAPKMTVSQALGLTILKAINANPAMNGHQVSVGTTEDTVMLNGKVKSTTQKKLAETITRQKAKKAKVINQITVSIK